MVIQKSRPLDYVEDFMDPNFVEIDEDTIISNAEKQMEEEGTDVAIVVKKGSPVNLVRIWQLWDLSPSEKVNKIPDLEEVQTVRVGTDLKSALDMLSDSSAVLVLDKGDRPVGALLRSDLLAKKK